MNKKHFLIFLLCTLFLLAPLSVNLFAADQDPPASYLNYNTELCQKKSNELIDYFRNYDAIYDDLKTPTYAVVTTYTAQIQSLISTDEAKERPLDDEVELLYQRGLTAGKVTWIYWMHIDKLSEAGQTKLTEKYTNLMGDDESTGVIDSCDLTSIKDLSDALVIEMNLTAYQIRVSELATDTDSDTCRDLIAAAKIELDKINSADILGTEYEKALKDVENNLTVQRNRDTATDRIKAIYAILYPNGNFDADSNITLFKSSIKRETTPAGMNALLGNTVKALLNNKITSEGAYAQALKQQIQAQIAEEIALADSEERISNLLPVFDDFALRFSRESAKDTVTADIQSREASGDTTLTVLLSQYVAEGGILDRCADIPAVEFEVSRASLLADWYESAKSLRAQIESAISPYDSTALINRHEQIFNDISAAIREISYTEDNADTLCRQKMTEGRDLLEELLYDAEAEKFKHDYAELLADDTILPEQKDMLTAAIRDFDQLRTATSSRLREEKETLGRKYQELTASAIRNLNVADSAAGLRSRDLAKLEESLLNLPIPTSLDTLRKQADEYLEKAVALNEIYLRYAALLDKENYLNYDKTYQDSFLEICNNASSKIINAQADDNTSLTGKIEATKQEAMLGLERIDAIAEVKLAAGSSKLEKVLETVTNATISITMETDFSKIAALKDNAIFRIHCCFKADTIRDEIGTLKDEIQALPDLTEEERQAYLAQADTLLSYVTATEEAADDIAVQSIRTAFEESADELCKEATSKNLQNLKEKVIAEGKNYANAEQTKMEGLLHIADTDANALLSELKNKTAEFEAAVNAATDTEAVKSLLNTHKGTCNAILKKAVTSDGEAYTELVKENIQALRNMGNTDTEALLQELNTSFTNFKDSIANAEPEGVLSLLETHKAACDAVLRRATIADGKAYSDAVIKEIRALAHIGDERIADKIAMIEAENDKLSADIATNMPVEELTERLERHCNACNDILKNATAEDGNAYADEIAKKIDALTYLPKDPSTVLLSDLTTAKNSLAEKIQNAPAEEASRLLAEHILACNNILKSAVTLDGKACADETADKINLLDCLSSEEKTLLANKLNAADEKLSADVASAISPDAVLSLLESHHATCANVLKQAETINTGKAYSDEILEKVDKLSCLSETEKAAFANDLNKADEKLATDITSASTPEEMAAFLKAHKDGTDTVMKQAETLNTGKAYSDKISEGLDTMGYLSKEEKDALCDKLKAADEKLAADVSSVSTPDEMAKLLEDHKKDCDGISKEAEAKNLENCAASVTDGIQKEFDDKNRYSQDNYEHLQKILNDLKAKLENAKTPEECLNIRESILGDIRKLPTVLDDACSEALQMLEKTYLELKGHAPLYSAKALEELEQLYRHSVEEIYTYSDISEAQKLHRFAEERSALMRKVKTDRVCTPDGQLEQNSSNTLSYPQSYDFGTNGYWGILNALDALYPDTQFQILPFDGSAKADAIRMSAKQKSVLNADKALLRRLGRSEVLTGLDITLVNGLTPADNHYRVRFLLPENIDGASVLGVIYLKEDGTAEYLSCKADGSMLEFTTSHFSEFYLVAESPLNLLPVILILCILLILEAIALLILVARARRRAQERETVSLSAFAPVPVLFAARKMIPTSAPVLIALLGFCAILLGIAVIKLWIDDIRARREEEEAECDETIEIAEPVEIQPEPEPEPEPELEPEPIPEPEPEPEPIESITVEEANQLLTDAEADQLIETMESAEDTEKAEEAEFVLPTTYGTKKAEINIDVISAHFEANDIVSLAVLKEKKLIPQSAGFVKILARGTLDKPLTVAAQDFSAAAVKMIHLTGGRSVIVDKAPSSPAKQ